MGGEPAAAQGASRSSRWVGLSKRGLTLPDCCSRRAYQQVFDADEAERNAARYRKSGLDSTARRIVELLSGYGLEGLTVLEVGGGIGDLQIELLRAGAARAVGVDLSPAYEAVAGKLLREAGLESRVERCVMDFAVEADQVQDADAVVMHSVICCYPDMERLVTAAARKARRYLVISYPRDRWYLQAYRLLLNLWQRLRGTGFRFYIHAPAAILASARAQGLSLRHLEQGWVDHLAMLERPRPR